MTNTTNCLDDNILNQLHDYMMLSRKHKISFQNTPKPYPTPKQGKQRTNLF